MTIYEELKELEKEAEREKRNKTYTLAEREYYAGMAQAFRAALELFEKRRQPHNLYKSVADFLPPEHKK